jgi:SAM-dependent methyltransferase
MFLLSMALLVLEITTTRMLSVAMAYHFAVMSISLAMLGLAAGGVFVFLNPALRSEDRAVRLGADGAALSAVAILFALLCFLGLPLRPVPSLAGLMNLFLLFAPQAIPYLCLGVAMSALLTAYPASIGAIYAADLAGAAAGCLVSSAALPLAGGGGTLLVAALAAALAALWLNTTVGPGRLPTLLRPGVWCVLLVLLLGLDLAGRTFEPVYIKGVPEISPDRIAWTTHSRVSFSPEFVDEPPFGWGFGRRFVRPQAPARFRRVRIDGLAETPILRWQNRSEDLSYLSWDLSGLPYLLKKGGRVLIVGSGGGRDILTAHLSGPWQVDAVEINEAIVAGLRGEFADYSGHVYDLPRSVRVLDGRTAFETAPARSYDLIQMSAVDTWAAGSSGAFALMENGLYTVESFRAILRALKPDGYLSVSRFKYPMDYFGETVRMVAIAIDALEEDSRLSSAAAASRILLVTNGSGERYSIANLLVKPTPFAESEIALAAARCAERGFDLVWPLPPDVPSLNPATALLRLQSSAERERFYGGYPIDIRPTRDDRPYFFHQTRLAHLATASGPLIAPTAMRLAPIATIFRLGLFLLAGAGALLIAPMLRASRQRGGTLPPTTLLYFVCLGIGFMLYEIPLVQRLTLSLGHPTQALTVVLFGLLAGTGLGSLTTGLVSEARRPRFHRVAAMAAAAAGLALAVWGERVTHLLFRAPGLQKAALATSLVLLLGVVLGTLFPMGVRALSAAGKDSGIAWCWAANGAASVFGSVLALILGTEAGARLTFLAGAGLYAAAAVLTLRLLEPSPSQVRT